MGHLVTLLGGDRRRSTSLRLVVGGFVVLALVFGAARASATPGSAAVSVITARGPATQSIAFGVPGTTKVTRTVTVRVKKKVVKKRVTFTVPTINPVIACSESSACDLAFQELTIAPGGHTGWHTHPGPTFVVVKAGEGTLYHGISGCPAHKYATGSGFFQPSTEVHNMRNEAASPLTLLAFYALPPGTATAAIRIDQPQPADCPSIP